ncbi:MAG: hypothetical protein LBH43_04235 [Treponema sp.]|nr:hypothetical protein [Treponema sp.]
MAEMTEEEADALDELWTKTTPKIRKGGRGSLYRTSRPYAAIGRGDCPYFGLAGKSGTSNSN